jgi:hypothetical protein
LVEQGKDGAVEDGHDQCSRSGREYGGIFVQGRIPAPMTAIFNLPVCPDVFEQVFG